MVSAILLLLLNVAAQSEPSVLSFVGFFFILKRKLALT